MRHDTEHQGRQTRTRMRLWAVGATVLGIAAGAAAVAATGVQGAASAKVTSNGGARDWVAFNSSGPSGSSIGAGETTLAPEAVIYIANTSTATNPVTITYTGDGKHRLLGTTTLSRGSATTVHPDIHVSGGFFQVRAKYPVIMGGHSEVLGLARTYSPEAGKYGFSRDVAVDSYLVPLDWQKACLPYPGSTCPAGATAPAPSPSASPSVR